MPSGMGIPAEESDLPGAFGRGGVRCFGDVVARPYRRGGWVRFLNRSGYASPRRFEREALIHRALWEAGFPTVRPLGYGFRRQGLLVEGLYLTARCDGVPWPVDWPAGVARLPELARAVVALDSWGLWAPDLNATNVLIGAEGLALLDWDRSAFLPNAVLLPLYRRRMLRSLAKLGATAEVRHAFQLAIQAAAIPGR